MAELSLKISSIDKLLDYAASGIGAIAGPLLLPWIAGKEAKAEKIRAQGKADAAQIEATGRAKTSAILARAQAEAREYFGAHEGASQHRIEITPAGIAQRIEFQETKRLVNITSILDNAGAELEGEHVDDHEPDPDWTARFFALCQDVSSTDLKKYWGRLLAGKIRNQKAVSLRTLYTLARLTEEDVKLFREICSYVVDEVIYYRASWHRYGALKYDNLLHLQDCGLVLRASTSLRRTLGSAPVTVRAKGCTLSIYGRNKLVASLGLPVSFPMIPLTAAGRQLLEITDCSLDEFHMRSLATLLRRQYHLLAVARVAEKSNAPREDEFVQVLPLGKKS